MCYLIVIVTFLFGTSLSVIQGIQVKQSLHIIGGHPTNITDISYQCSLGNDTVHFCGGVLLSEEWVLTAAHCIGKMGKYKVRINSTRANSGGKLIEVIADYKHPYFNEIYSYDYDVALVRVKKFNPIGIQFARWPLCTTKKCSAIDGNMINISGWGINNISNGNDNVKLQKVSIPIVNYNDCKNIYLNDTDITRRMFCAGDIKNGGKDSCEGDSGGPATCNGDLVGIVSAGTEDCGLAGRPGVYTDLMNAKIQKWLKIKTGLVRNCQRKDNKFGNKDLLLDELPSWVKWDEAKIFKDLLNPKELHSLDETAFSPGLLNANDQHKHKSHRSKDLLETKSIHSIQEARLSNGYLDAKKIQNENEAKISKGIQKTKKLLALNHARLSQQFLDTKKRLKQNEAQILKDILKTKQIISLNQARLSQGF